MAKKDKYEDLANKVLEYIGGKENISFFTHCITRLRFNVKDESKVNTKEIDKIKGVIGTQWQNGQLQIIIGQDVADAYKLICEKTGLEMQDSINENKDGGEKKKFSIGTIFDGISGCIAPLIPVLIGSGMIKIVVLLGEMIGILTPESSTYIVLTFVGDAGFYFLPILLGATTARKFGGNMGLGMLLGAIMVHPTFISLVGEGANLSVFGLPIHNTTYTSTIFPTIMAVFVMCKVEKLIANYSPDAIRSITEPLLTLLIMVPLTLCLIGPLGSVLGVYFSDAIVWLYETLGFVGIAVLSAVFPFLVMTGMHGAFAPYMVQSIASLGYEPIVTTASFISTFNQGAAAAAVGVKTKDINLKSTAFACCATAFVGGVSEPAMFGINLKLKKPMYASMIGGLCGGSVAGIMQAHAYAFASSSSIFALPVYVSAGLSGLTGIVAGIVVGVVVTFIATLVLYKDEEVK